MLDLFEELTAVTSALSRAGIDHALVGGLACSVWLQPRNTVDIDLLVRPEDWERIVEMLSPLGYRHLAGPMDFETIRIRRLTKIEGGDTMILDCLLADGELSRGIERSTRLEFEGTSVAVAPPDVIIELKQGRMSDQDKIDIAALRKLLNGDDL